MIFHIAGYKLEMKEIIKQISITAKILPMLCMHAFHAFMFFSFFMSDVL